ncbi:MAG: hypothetical protein RIS55_732 [Actinomycetota bacterium]|jgi:hypothetical protein
MAYRLTVALPLWLFAHANPIDQPEPEPDRILASDT